MSLIAWTISILVLLLIASKQSKTLKYYLHLVACGLAVQLGLLLPYFYFPFRPFDYRNAK